MNRLIATVGVLLLGGTARADMAAPWPINYRVPVRLTITSDAPPPGVEVFVVSAFGARGTPHRLTAHTPVVLKANDGGVMFNAFAVQSTTLSRFAGGVPPHDWFQFGNPESRPVGGDRVRGRLDFFDGRSEEIREYHLEWRGEGASLRKVSDNSGSRWWYTWPCCATSVAIPVGILWLVGWMLGRVLSRRSEVSAGKQLPPPATHGFTAT